MYKHGKSKYILQQKESNQSNKKKFEKTTWNPSHQITLPPIEHSRNKINPRITSCNTFEEISPICSTINTGSRLGSRRYSVLPDLRNQSALNQSTSNIENQSTLINKHPILDINQYPILEINQHPILKINQHPILVSTKSEKKLPSFLPPVILLEMKNHQKEYFSHEINFLKTISPKYNSSSLLINNSNYSHIIASDVCSNTINEVDLRFNCINKSSECSRSNNVKTNNDNNICFYKIDNFHDNINLHKYCKTFDFNSHHDRKSAILQSRNINDVNSIKNHDRSTNFENLDTRNLTVYSKSKIECTNMYFKTENNLLDIKKTTTINKIVSDAMNESNLTLCIKMPDGAQYIGNFNANKPIISLLKFAEYLSGEKLRGCIFKCHSPNKIFGNLKKLFNECFIKNRTTLYLQLP